MQEIVEFIREGGPVATAMLGLGPVSVVAAVLMCALIVGLGSRVPASLSWLPISGILALGAVGQVLGLRDVDEAVTYAAADQRVVLAAVGIAYASVCGVLGAAWGGAGLLATAGITGMIAPLRAGPEARFDGRGAGGALGGAALGGLIAVVGVGAQLGLAAVLSRPGFLTTLVLASLFATLASVLAGLRVSAVDRRHQARMVGLRGFVLSSGAFGVLLLAFALGDLENVQALRFASEVTPDSAPWSATHVALPLGVWLTLPPAFAGFFGMIPFLGRADQRVAVGVAVGLVQLVLVLVARVGLDAWAAGTIAVAAGM